MPSIDDFVSHRWADAKEALRKLDADYVGEIETTVQLQCLGLEPPRLPDVNRIPKQRLCSGWHILLENCDELVRQATILQTATDRLIADSDAKMPSVEVGKRFLYHMHSGFIHANTLAVRSSEVVKKTAKLYISDQGASTNISETHVQSIFHEVTNLVAKGRNEYAHGTTRSWSSSITKDELWEIAVAGGLTPMNAHNDFHYTTLGEIVISGRYRRFADLTATILERLGGILHNLEEDIAAHYSATLQP